MAEPAAALLVIVSVCAKLVLPCPVGAKFRLTVGTEGIAVVIPERLVVCVPTASTTVSVPVRVPPAVGVKVTPMLQEPVASELVHEFATGTTAKSPVVVMLVIESADWPVLDSMAVIAELVVPIV